VADSEVNVKLSVESSAFEAGLESARDGLQDLGDELKRTGDKAAQAGEELKRTGDKAKQSGHSGFGALLSKLKLIPSATAVAAGGMAAMGSAINSCIKQAAAFEVALDNVNTILELNDRALRDYGQSVTDLARDLKMGITSTEALAGAYEVASAGFTEAADTQEVLRAALVAAKGGLTDSRTAVDGITSVLNAYKLSASEATRVSDLMFQAVMDGKTTFPELANGIGEVISTAAAAKVPLEQLFAAIAHMTVQGIRTPQAMTALNAAIMQMLAPSDAAKKALKEVGLSAEDLSKTLKTQGIAEVFGDIFRATDGNEEKIRAILGDMTAVKAALALAGDNAAAFEEKIRRMGDSSGVALKAAKTNSDNLATSWADLQDAASELGKEIGGLTTGSLKAFTDHARDSIDKIRENIANPLKGLEKLDPFEMQVGYKVQAPAELETPTWLARFSGSFTQGEIINKTTENLHKFYQENAEGRAIIGKSADELVRMNATTEQLSKAIRILASESKIAEGADAESRMAEARRLHSMMDLVAQEAQARQQAADAQEAEQKAAADAEVAAQKEKSDQVMAIHAELQRKLRVGVYETTREELAARDRVLQVMVDAGLGQTAEATRLKEERVRLARAAADEETAMAVSALTRRIRFGKASADEEIAELERILAAHRGSATQRQQIEDQLLAAQQKRDAQREADARKALASKLQAIDMERARAASARNLSTQEEIAFQQRVVALHKQGTSERAQAEIALYNLKARLRQEEESALQRLRALEAELVNARTDEIDDQIADLQDKMAAEQEAGRSTAATHQAIVELMREKLAIQPSVPR
jgi:TP901 family phage tail tape measure protein